MSIKLVGMMWIKFSSPQGLKMFDFDDLPNCRTSSSSSGGEDLTPWLVAIAQSSSSPRRSLIVPVAYLLLWTFLDLCRLDSTHIHCHFDNFVHVRVCDVQT